MISTEEFKKWLNSENGNLFSFKENNASYGIMKVPKADGFYYLYTQCNYGKDSIVRNRRFEYSGIYNQEDGLIYDSHGYFRKLFPEMEHNESLGQMSDTVTDKVQRLIWQTIGNDRSKLSITELSNKGMELLPNDHKAKWFAGAALNTAEQSMASVMSTALSRLNSFLDSELEQLLCFDTEIDAEKFCNEKSAIFVIMPEENPNTFFMISLIIQQLYREILAVADENKGKLKNRCIFFCDEFGTLPKIESAEMMFSASRSRRLQIVPIIQSFSQLDKNYGKEGAEIIVDNTQLTIFGGFAPNSSSAEVLSKALGSRTVMSGSVSRSKNDPSQSLQMIERPLLTPDELKSMPKGQFVVMKTGVHPIRVRLKLFKNWGISFNEKEPYTVADKGDREVEYAEKQEIITGIMKKYRKTEYEEMKEAEAAATAGGQDQAESQSNEPQQTPPKNSNDKKKGGNDLKTEPPSRRHTPPSRAKREVKPSEQA